MDVTTLLLADYASRDQGGKFTLVGAGISEIKTREVPFVYPLIFLFIRIQTTLQDLGNNKIEIQIIGEKGRIFKSEGNITVAPDNHEKREVPIPFQLVNLKFPSDGEYNIDVSINGKLKQSQSFRVRKVNPPVQEQGESNAG